MTGFESLAKILIILGLFCLAIGLVLLFWQKIPLLGRLPGDIIIQKGNFKFFFPLVTCLLLSLLLTLIINLVIRLLGR